MLYLILVQKRTKNAQPYTHASHLFLELQSCEHQLAWTLEAVQLYGFLIRSFALDPADPQRDASFVLDVSSQNYKGKSWIELRGFVLTLFLLILSDYGFAAFTVDGDTLIETRDVFAFIRDVRAAYRPLVSWQESKPSHPFFLAQFDVRSR
jgi:kinetochore protein Spc25